MKKYFFILALFVPLAVFAQKKESKINWVSIEQAQELAKKDTNKIILLDVYTKWCGPCKMMSKNTFGDKVIIDYVNKHFIAVKFDAEGPDDVTFNGKKFSNPDYDPDRKGRNATHQFASIAQNSGRLAYPTLVFLNHNGEIITPVTGYLTGPQLEPILGFLGTKSFFKTTYENYTKNFTSKYSGK